LIFLYLGEGQWRRFELGTVARRGQEVELQEEVRIERENR